MGPKGHDQLAGGGSAEIGRKLWDREEGEKRIRSDCSVNVLLGQNALREVPGWAGQEKLRRGWMANRKGLDSLDSLLWKAMSVSLVLGGKRTMSRRRSIFSRVPRNAAGRGSSAGGSKRRFYPGPPQDPYYIKGSITSHPPNANWVGLLGGGDAAGCVWLD